jgi:hypothetical protein
MGLYRPDYAKAGARSAPLHAIFGWTCQVVWRHVALASVPRSPERAIIGWWSSPFQAGRSMAGCPGVDALPQPHQVECSGVCLHACGGPFGITLSIPAAAALLAEAVGAPGCRGGQVLLGRCAGCPAEAVSPSLLKQILQPCIEILRPLDLPPLHSQQQLGVIRIGPVPMHHRHWALPERTHGLNLPVVLAAGAHNGPIAPVP